MRGKCLFLVIMIIYLDITNIEMTIAASIFDYVDTFLCKKVLRIHSIGIVHSMTFYLGIRQIYLTNWQPFVGCKMQ